MSFARWKPRKGESGAAFMEFALALPLFIFTIWGFITVISLSRAKLQLAMVTHAVVREAAAGLTDSGRLTMLGRAYAEAVGMGKEVADTVHIKASGSLLVTNITVSVSPQIPDSLKMLTGGLVMTCTNDCVADTWKNPVQRLFGL